VLAVLLHLTARSANGTRDAQPGHS